MAEGDYEHLLEEVRGHTFDGNNHPPFELEDAWIGDAYLCLYVRRRLLEIFGEIKGQLADKVLCNENLRKFGTLQGIYRATQVEAHICRLWKKDEKAVEFFCEDLFRWSLGDELNGWLEFHEKNCEDNARNLSSDAHNL